MSQQWSPLDPGRADTGPHWGWIIAGTAWALFSLGCVAAVVGYVVVQSLQQRTAQALGTSASTAPTGSDPRVGAAKGWNDSNPPWGRADCATTRQGCAAGPGYIYADEAECRQLMAEGAAGVSAQDLRREGAVVIDPAHMVLLPDHTVVFRLGDERWPLGLPSTWVPQRDGVIMIVMGDVPGRGWAVIGIKDPEGVHGRVPPQLPSLPPAL